MTTKFFTVTMIVAMLMVLFMISSNARLSYKMDTQLKNTCIEAGKRVIPIQNSGEWSCV